MLNQSFSNKSRENLTNEYDQDVIDDKTLEVTDIILNCVLLNVISLFGIVGNVLNILVLSQHNVKESTTIVLLSLSVVDLIVVISAPIRRSSCLISFFDETAAQDIVDFEKMYISSVNKLVMAISASHIVLISVERTVAVYLPFQVSSIFSPFRTRVYLIFIYTFWTVLKIPFFDRYTYELELDEERNITLRTLVYSKFLEQNYEILVALNVMLSNIRGPVNVSIVLVCSILIVARLYFLSTKRSKITHRTQKTGHDLKIMKMLLVVSLLYLAVGIPVFIPYVFAFYITPEAFVTSNGSPNNLYMLMDFVIDLLYVINGSVNFVIYVLMSAKFSKTFKKLVKCNVWSKSLKWKNSQILTRSMTEDGETKRQMAES